MLWRKLRAQSLDFRAEDYSDGACCVFSKQAKNLPVRLDFGNAIGYDEKIPQREFAEEVK
jgi:hypothetical protein